jgi:DNA-directed RNA polymerase beta subunit
LDERQLLAVKEEALEMGGYFICNGNERVIRLLIMPKRNHVCSLPQFVVEWMSRRLRSVSEREKEVKFVAWLLFGLVPKRRKLPDVPK